MITFTVRMKFNKDDHAEIAKTLQELTRQSRQEPGCVSYIAHWVESDPDTVLIYEQYKDEEAVEAHRASPHFAKAAVGVLYQKMLERVVENLQAIG
jgi:quinol monooxygenase YgiN